MPPLYYPRMLFRGDLTCVVADADAQAVKVAEGWEPHWLPCDGPPPEPVEPKRGPGRARKE